MSIRTGKDNYEAISEFRERTEKELKNRSGTIFKRDTEPPQSEIDYIRESLRGAKSVLELGCGFGIWADVADSVGAGYTGIDPIEERVFLARQRTKDPTAVFMVGDARTLRHHAFVEYYDVVLFANVLQHMTLPDAIAALKTASFHLQMGGKVVLLESRIWDISLEECEKRYADASCALHMIPMPLQVLKDAVYEFKWARAGKEEDRFHLTKDVS